MNDTLRPPSSLPRWLFHYASPAVFYPLAGRLIPWFWALAALFGVAGLYVSFFVAPTDAVQGEAGTCTKMIR